jgi:hypothetical protein
MTEPATPELVVLPVDEAGPWHVVRAQQHADGTVVQVQCRTIERAPGRTILWTRYEPGVVLRQHTHACDQVTLVVEGEFTAGNKRCAAPSVLVLEQGARFGPVVAGPEGALLLEVFIGASTSSTGTDLAGYQALLAELGIRPLDDSETVQVAEQIDGDPPGA